MTVNCGCVMARGVKSGLCDSQRPWLRASREFMRAVKGYIAKLGVVDLCECHLVKVKRKNLKYIFIGKFLYRYVLIVSILDYLIFNVFISL